MAFHQASFYSYAVYGHGLNDSMLGGGPKVVGGMKGNLTGSTAAYALEIAEDEIKYAPLPLLNLCATKDAYNVYMYHSMYGNFLINEFPCKLELNSVLLFRRRPHDHDGAA
jgi:hypothetical protein